MSSVFLNGLAALGDGLKPKADSRFYVFNSPEAVESHIDQVKTVADVLQLGRDIAAANCNLCRFKVGIPGVWAVDYAKGYGRFQRHLFILSSLAVAPTAEECDRYTIISG
jgi:hypothetical protein